MTPEQRAEIAQILKQEVDTLSVWLEEEAQVDKWPRRVEIAVCNEMQRLRNLADALKEKEPKK